MYRLEGILFHEYDSRRVIDALEKKICSIAILGTEPGNSRLARLPTKIQAVSETRH